MARIARTGVQLAWTAVLAGACSGTDGARSADAETGAADSATLAASGGDPAGLRVSNVMIGRQIGPGNRITDPTFQFAPQDTVHISVATTGGGSGTLTAAWRSQNGEIVQKSAEPVPAAGENAGFHLSQPKGLKPGTYKVIVFLGADSVETKVFVVKK